MGGIRHCMLSIGPCQWLACARAMALVVMQQRPVLRAGNRHGGATPRGKQNECGTLADPIVKP
jgi:hypothetical protein